MTATLDYVQIDLPKQTPFLTKRKAPPKRAPKNKFISTTHSRQSKRYFRLGPSFTDVAVSLSAWKPLNKFQCGNTHQTCRLIIHATSKDWIQFFHLTV
jgi:hypothetical protein